MRNGFLTLCLLFTAFLSLFAEEQIDQLNESLDLFAEPSSYVHGVNVITGRFTYSTTDMIIQGPRSFEVRKSYFQGYEGSLATCWEINTQGKLDYLPTRKWARITHGNLTGLTYVDDCLDPEVYNKGFTNARGKIGGRTHPKNMRLNLSKKGIIRLSNGEGGIQSFKKNNKRTFKLVRDKQTDGFATYYDSKSLWSSTPSQIKQLMANFLIDNHHFFVKEANSQRLVEHTVKQGLLKKTVRPLGPDEEYSYSKVKNSYALAKIQRPEGRFLEINYQDSGKVATLLAPVGPGGESVKTHTFHYSDHGTVVVDAAGRQTSYQYDKKRRLTAVQKYIGKSLYFTDQFFWGKNEHEGNLLSRVVSDGTDQPLFCRTLEYDKFGNVTNETLWGNLTGTDSPNLKINKGIPEHNGCEHYQKSFTYSQDGLNLLLKENDGRKEVVYSYKPGTNVLLSKILWTQKGIQSRHFYEYDNNGFLVREIEDNGILPLSEDLTGVTERHITVTTPSLKAPIGLPAAIEKRYLDLKTRQEVLLSKIEYDYSAEGYLLNEKHFDGLGTYMGSIVRHYNGKGQVIEEYNQLTHCTKRYYDPNGNLLCEDGPRKGFCKSFTYDKANRLVQENEHLDNGVILTKQNCYDELSNKIASIDEYGNMTQYKYDDLNRLVKVIYPSIPDDKGNLIQPEEHFSYNALNQLVENTDANGNTTRYRYNVRGQITEIVYPNGASAKKQYSLEGWLVKDVDLTGLTTCYSHDEQGRVIEKAVYSPQGEFLYRTTSTYNAFHLLSETDAAGYVTNYTYDQAGRLITTQKGNKVTENVYDSFGRIAQIREAVNGDFRITVKLYNPLDQVIEERIEDLQGHVYAITSYSYDEMGNCISKTQGTATVLTEYDPHGKPTIITDALGYKTLFYEDYNFMNELGQRVACRVTIDALGNKETVIQDALRRTAKVLKCDAKGNPLHETYHFYDRNGNNILEIEAVHTTDSEPRIFTIARTYDSMNNVVSVTEAYGHPEQKTQHYVYNKCNQKISHIKYDGSSIQYDYDILGRLATIKSSDGTIHYSYSYDIKNNILVVHDHVQKNTTTRSYDEYDRITEETLANGLTIRKNYDALDRVICLTLPDASQVHYTYNPAHLSAITRNGYTHQYSSYDICGRVLEAVLPFGVGSITYTYDLNGHCTSLATPHDKDKFTYDPIGNLIQTSKHNYGYDDLYQLIQEDDHAYQYDSLHNRTAKDHSIQTINNLNQLVSEGSNAYQYDLNGNLLLVEAEEGITKYSYDALNRLVKVQTPKTTVNYAYDAFHRRLCKIIDGNNHHYLYEADNEIGMLSQGKIQELRILGIGLGAEIGANIALEIQGQVFIPIHDQIGNVTQVIDNQGNITDTYTYSAFGEEITPHKSLSPWRHSSKRIDPETGFAYFGKRYYNPKLGRWTTPDPADFLDSNNLYAYLHNNPLKYVDPDGRFAFAIPLFYITFSAECEIICAVSCYAIASILTAGVIYQGLELANSLDEKVGRPYPYPGDDPAKCPGEGFVWKGKGPPGSREGSWHNDKTGESLHPDLSHSPPIGPHWDYQKGKGTGKEEGRIFPNGTLVPK